MIITSQHTLPVVTADSRTSYPLLPLRTGVLLPGITKTLQIGRPENLKLVEYCLKNKCRILASYSPTEKDIDQTPQVHQIGVIADITATQKGLGGSLMVTIEGQQRAVINEITERTPFWTAEASMAENAEMVPADIGGRMSEVLAVVREITSLDPTYSLELINVLQMNDDDPSQFADQAAANFHFPIEAQQELLEAVNLNVRFERLLHHLNAELSRVATMRNIDDNARRGLDDDERRAFLERKLQEIRRELGEDLAEEKEGARIKKQIRENQNLPPEVVARAVIEADRLSQLSSASAEFGVTKNYLDWLLSLPWGKATPEDYDITEVEKTISSGFFGPGSVREQILQRLSVRKLLGGVNEGPTLCLVGAPGTGKASLAKAIARALGKEFIRISVGGISEAAEVKGTPRTFLGAMPGKVIRTLRNAGSCDPVILIEDIDYFNMDNDSSVNMALLEAIDIRRNNRFLDAYLGVPFDLSKVLFICSVRSWEEIPEQFIPRFEIIELPGYIEKEKIVIAKRYIIPSLLNKHGILKSEISLNNKVLSVIINSYTQEAGLVGFAQQMEKICRRIALSKQSTKRKKWTITEADLEKFLGSPIYIPEKAEKEPEIGTATGLAWTGSGGDLMFIEGLKMKGDGQITTTGSLGDVMRESISAAHSYVRSKADMLAIDHDDFNQFDIHIHFPSGAIPKDGPSAGVTVSLVIASVMSERPIRNDVAMTGEVTLRGRVLPVGGIKEKVSAAFRAGIFHVVLPKENQKDLRDLPKEIVRKSKFTFIERVDELFELCLLDFTPSTFSLEKIFAEEIERARKKAEPSKKKTPAARKTGQGGAKKKPSTNKRRRS